MTQTYSVSIQTRVLPECCFKLPERLSGGRSLCFSILASKDSVQNWKPCSANSFLEAKSVSYWTQKRLEGQATRAFLLVSFFRSKMKTYLFCVAYMLASFSDISITALSSFPNREKWFCSCLTHRIAFFNNVQMTCDFTCGVPPDSMKLIAALNSFSACKKKQHSVKCSRSL